MSLIADLIAKDKAGIFKYANTFGHYSTGILPLDYINAFKLRWRDADNKQHVDIVPGVIGGKFITIIGLSGGGKTTLAQQIGWNIIKNFEDGVMIHEDCEHTALRARIYDITDMDSNDMRFVLNDSDAYIETVMKQIDTICDAKEAAGKDAMYEIDGKWFGKKTVWIYAPTVFIIDSLPSFASKDTKDDTLEGQMSTNREVGMISQFYQKQLNKLAKYNITVIAINHIKSKIEVNPYSYTKPQLMMLKKDESLPRGQAPVFYASSVFRLNPCGLSEGYKSEDWGFDGFKCILQVAKSKTTYIGGQISMVFREDKGYDPIYTLLQFAYDCDLISGMNRKDKPGLYFTALPDYKFSKAGFGNEFMSNFKFRMEVLKVLQPYFEAIAGCKETDKNDVDKYVGMDKLCALDENGNLIAVNIAENDNGELVALNTEEIAS